MPCGLLNSPPYKTIPLFPFKLHKESSYLKCVFVCIYVCVLTVYNPYSLLFLPEFSWNPLPLLRRPHRMAPVFTFIGSSPPKLWLTGLFELSTITSTSFTAPILTSLCWEPQAMFTSCLYPPPLRVLVPIVLLHANTYYLSTFEPWACRLTTYVFRGERFDLAS